MKKTKRIIYVFNPEADYALAEFKDSYTPPASVVNLRKRLAPDQLRYAGPEDFILFLDTPAMNPEKMIDKRCIYPDNSSYFFKEMASHPEDYEFRPWNWTPDLVSTLRRWGAPESLLPDRKRLELIRSLSDRATTIEFNRELNRNLETSGLKNHLSPLPLRFENVEEALAWKKKKGKVFFKYPWSSSGRGVLLADDTIDDEKLTQWLRGGIRRQGHVIGETFFDDKKIDFATEWKLESGKAKFLGISLFEATVDGHYIRNILKTQKEVIALIRNDAPEFTFKFIEAQKDALEKVAPEYSGFVGIDMMADSEGRIRGGVELNFRMTMGIAALLENAQKDKIFMVTNNQGITKPKIIILGKGNVGSHLAEAFFRAGEDVELLSAREKNLSFNQATHIIIAVKDRAIKEVSEMICNKISALPVNERPIVVHTSGSIPISVLTEALPAGTPLGVFYPMQTFTKGVEMDYTTIPFLLEASDPQTLLLLKELASPISNDIVEADSEVRAAYHIAAVLTCNFTNHLCSIASDYLAEKGLEFRILLPLLEQTVAKLRTSTPQEAQTGPAARGDQKVIDYHLSKLAQSPHISEIYRLLSQSISNYSKNGEE